MPIFGLTGNLASGKSTVLELLIRKGALVFDADKRVHQYYRQRGGLIFKKIAKAFPQALERGSISRRKLADIVFADRNKLATLEKIVHPAIIKDMLKWKKSLRNKKRICVAEVPLLFEKKLTRYFDGVILVLAKQPVLIKRIIEKYKFSKSQVLRRLSLYVAIRKKIKGADFIINNSSSLRKLNEEVDLLWKKINQK
jgi:dephospho-CoA kinase